MSPLTGKWVMNNKSCLASSNSAASDPRRLTSNRRRRCCCGRRRHCCLGVDAPPQPALLLSSFELADAALDLPALDEFDAVVPHELNLRSRARPALIPTLVAPAQPVELRLLRRALLLLRKVGLAEQLLSARCCCLGGFCLGAEEGMWDGGALSAWLALWCGGRKRVRVDGLASTCPNC